jgi:hypothetical protein
VDKEGQFSYSNTIAIHRSTISELRPWPNPFTDAFSLSLESPANGQVTLKLINASGKVQAQQKAGLVKGNNQLSLTGLGQLPKGIYLLSIQTDQGEPIKPIKLIKN